MLHNLIRNIVLPLKTSTIGHDALGLMDEAKVSHLPIVNNEDFLGIISEEDLLSNDLNESIGTYKLSISNTLLLPDNHLFDAIRLVCNHKLTLVPVVSSSNKYLGYLDINDLICELGSLMSLDTPGSIIEIELNINDYFLSRIVQLIESNDTKVIHSSVKTLPDSTRLLLTLKLDKIDISSVIQTLNRYEYKITGSYGLEEDNDYLQERYDMLMKYLNI